jgi:hypothetical protein
VNLGDIAVFHNNPKATRQSVINSASTPMTIYPGEVVKKGHEDSNYQFYWFLKRNDVYADAEFDDIRDTNGYAVCTRDEWELPKGRFRYDEAGHITYMGHILLFRDEQVWRESQAKAHAEARGQVGSTFDDVHEMADELGLETFEQRAGGDIKKGATGRRR